MTTLAARQSVSLAPRGRAWTSGVLATGPLTERITVRLRRPTTAAPLAWERESALEVAIEVQVGNERYACVGGTTGGIRTFVDPRTGAVVESDTYELAWDLPVLFADRARAYLEVARRDAQGYVRDVPLTRLGELTPGPVTVEVRIRPVGGRRGASPRGAITTELLALETSEAPAPVIPRHKNSVAFAVQTSVSEQFGDGTISVSCTATGANTAAIVHTAVQTGGSGSGTNAITYGGTSMGAARFFSTMSGNVQDEISGFCLAGVPTSAQTVSHTATTFEPNRHLMHVTTYTGVDQTTPVVTSSPNTATASTNGPGTVDVGGSLAAGDMVVDFVWGLIGTPSVGGDQTSRVTSNVAEYRAGTSTQSGSAGATMSWTFSGGADAWVIGAFTLKEAASGLSATINQVTESDAALSMGRRKTRTIGQIAETDAALAMTRRKTRAIGQPVENDTPFSLSRRKTRAIAQVTEAGSALPMRAVRRYPLGLVTENDLAQAITRAKQRAIAQVTEANSALGMGRTKRRAIGLVTEANLAQAMSRVKRLMIAQVIETDAALAFGSQMVATIGMVTEADTALGVSRRKTRPIGLVTEADLVHPLASRKAKAIALVMESDSALAMQRIKRRMIGQVSEVDSTFAMAHLKRMAIGLITESDSALALVLAGGQIVLVLPLTTEIAAICGARTTELLASLGPRTTEPSA